MSEIKVSKRSIAWQAAFERLYSAPIWRAFMPVPDDAGNIAIEVYKPGVGYVTAPSEEVMHIISTNLKQLFEQFLLEEINREK